MWGCTYFSVYINEGWLGTLLLLLVIFFKWVRELALFLFNCRLVRMKLNWLALKVWIEDSALVFRCLSVH